MAITQYYVSPASGNDSTGTGAVGAPWLTTQHALNTITQGAGGDQINIQAGSADVLSAALSLTTYGTPTRVKPLIFRGYTSVANDGGIGDLSGNASVGIFPALSKNHVYLKDLHCHNCGAANIIDAGGTTVFGVEHCEIDTTTGVGVRLSEFVFNSYIHDIGGGFGIQAATVAAFNRLESLTKSPSTAMMSAATALHNTVALTAAANTINGLQPSGSGLAFGNSVWANGGKGVGIQSPTSSTDGSAVVSNIVEGFSGAGGVGISDNGGYFNVYGKNFLFNNTTGVSLTLEPLNIGADTTTGSSSFNNPSGSPPDLSLSANGVTSCKAQAYPGAYYGSPFTSYRDAGAVQHQDSGGAAGMLYVPNLDGV